jgi:hypothetical protein
MWAQHTDNDDSSIAAVMHYCHPWCKHPCCYLPLAQHACVPGHPQCTIGNMFNLLLLLLLLTSNWAFR